MRPPASSSGSARRRPAGRCRCACTTGSEVYEPFPERDAAARRPAAAWTAASRSATTAARSATSSPTGTTSSTATTGATPSSACTPPTTSPSSPAGCARRRARPRACSASTRTRSRSSRSRSRSSTAPGTRAGSTPVVPDGAAPGKRVAVVGSGPAGLAAAQQLTRAGHDVVVFERADRIGGLLRYGIPEFKMEKRHLDRRLEQMEAEGTEFRVNVNVGVDVERRRAARRVRRDRARRRRHRVARPARSPAASSAASTRRWSTCRWGNRVQQGDLDEPPITAAGKHVVIIGGGDTGADCLGTVAPPGRGVGAPVRDPAPAARRRARRPTRGPRGRTSSACRRRTRRAASASTA